MMTPRRFWGSDITAALREVRAALGPDALILDSKDLTEIGGGVEVTALSDKPEPPVEKWRAEPTAKLNAANDAAPAPNENSNVGDELRALRSLIYWLAPNLQHNNRVLQSLARRGMSMENIARLSDQMRDLQGADEREKLMQALIASIPSGGRIRDEVMHVALVGPTGVGKTTNLIKLTVFENQRLSRRIGWINADQRHLVSGDPLALYASILGVRYETAADAKELR